VRWIWLLPLLAAGCTWDWDRFDPRSGDGPPLRCSWADPARFTLAPPVPVTEINTSAREIEPFLSPDGLTLYFASERGDGKLRCYLARRDKPEGPFGAVEEQSGINLPQAVSRFVVSADGLTAYIAALRDYPKSATGDAEIFTAERKSPGEPFTSAQFAPLDKLNTQENEWDPFISPDGLRLYYAEHVPSKSQNRLMVAERSTTGGTWSKKGPIPGLDLTDLSPKTKSDNPAVTADELTIVFSSDHAGSVAGSRDLWYAVRTDLSQPFSAPRQLPAVNTDQWESEVTVTPDGCRLYFTRVDDIFTTHYIPK
jgi:Tol biopolymer transport system component